MTLPTPNSVALVTGAAQGIGKAIALRLADDGHDIVLNDIAPSRDKLEQVAHQLRRTGRKVTAVTADISSADDVAVMFDQVVTDHGRLNVLVANAGIARLTPLLDMDVSEWDQVIEVNLRGTFLCMRAAARQMIGQGKGGKILVASSINGFRASPFFGHYSATKWGLRGLTQSAAQEWAEHGITVNAYCPGNVETEMLDTTMATVARMQGLTRHEVRENLVKSVTLGRLETPEDVAKLVSFLASPDSDYMTSQSILVDGGVQFA